MSLSPKDILAYGLKKLGLKPSSFRVVNDPIYLFLNHSHLTFSQYFLCLTEIVRHPNKINYPSTQHLLVSIGLNNMTVTHPWLISTVSKKDQVNPEVLLDS